MSLGLHTPQLLSYPLYLYEYRPGQLYLVRYRKKLSHVHLVSRVKGVRVT